MNFDNVWTWIFLAIFIVDTSLHLYASIKNNKKFRNATKGFILLSLLGFYLAATPKEYISLNIILALAFSWLGDVLLMPNGVKWFTAGGISFMASHIFFVLAYSEIMTFSNIPVFAIIFLGVFFASAVFIIFKKLKPSLPKALFYPMALYLLINGTMNCFAIYRLLDAITSEASILPALTTALGAILFFISDASLFFVRFDKNTKMKSHFRVMLTYSIGEFLIVLGLMLEVLAIV